MSLLFSSNGSEGGCSLRENNGTSTLLEHSTSVPRTLLHTTRRKHKHKKHKKHRRDKIRSRSKSENFRSRINLIDDNKAQFDNVSKDKRSSGDHLKKSEFSAGPIEEMSDFTWLTKEFQFSDITDTFESESTISHSSTDITSPESELSQRTTPSSIFPVIDNDSTNKQDERALIEQKIHERCAEMNVLIEKIQSKRHRSRRRRKYQCKKYEDTDSRKCGAWISPSVNICPIKRDKRCAQPIREALLVRTAMRKAWKGLLGSCCGRGCWATWRWVSLRGVISDYE